MKPDKIAATTVLRLLRAEVGELLVPRGGTIRFGRSESGRRDLTKKRHEPLAKARRNDSVREKRIGTAGFEPATP